MKTSKGMVTVMLPRNRLLICFFCAGVACVGQTGLTLNAAEDAAALIARVLETNKPWLEVRAASGAYNLLRRPDGQPDELLGPFSLLEPSPLTPTSFHWPTPQRVGAILWTPLHIMAHRECPYTSVLTGTTNWYQYGSLVRVDVTFTEDAVCEIGMGGQAKNGGQISYTSGGAFVKTAQILIKPQNAVPVYIETHPSPTKQPQAVTSWRFDPLFLSVDGGLAPRSLDFEAPFFRERQEFQVVGNIWIFRRGDGWFGTNPPGTTGHIQTLELTNLTNLRVEMGLALKVSGDNIAISSSGDLAGFNVESADTTEGPWVLVRSQTSPDKSTLILAKPTDKAVQFYRLWK